MNRRHHARGELDVEALWTVLANTGVIENGTWVSFQREDAEHIAADYALALRAHLTRQPEGQ
jgi:hypothetical protein